MSSLINMPILSTNHLNPTDCQNGNAVSEVRPTQQMSIYSSPAHQNPIFSNDTIPTLILDMEKIKELRQKIKGTLELSNVDIPENIKISTMTLEAKLNTKFYPWNIYKYIRRDNDGIINVVKENRNKKIKKGKNKNKQSEVFLNQVTVSIRVSNKEKPVSVKIFNSGTVHFTGCVCIDNLLEAVYKLCLECRREVAVIGKDGRVKDIKFAENINELRVENLYDFKIDMINCIFVVPFKIDRPKLQTLLKSEGYNSAYDSNGHAGVRIKYVSTKNKITIFVFESGSIIIILGNQGFGKINEVYNFIYKYLLSNYDTIIKDDECATSSILRYLEKEKRETEKKENDMKLLMAKKEKAREKKIISMNINAMENVLMTQCFD
jgi:TATA-box binding protein (TBP) (component of TFIID and TFIIIB)